MRNFIRKMVLMAMTALAMLFGFTSPVMAQKSGKISPSTRLVLRDRDGKMSLETPQGLTRDKHTTFSSDGSIATREAFGGGRELPFAKPMMVGGLQMVQCWIGMTDQNYSRLEALGVKIQAKFDDRVTANVPVVAIEQVASLSNVTKVSVAKRLKEKTYRSRILTNVDDVLNYSAEAKSAGLAQAYNGTGVVLGVIDTGIDFGHQMFKDANGNSRIKKKYVYNTTDEELQEFTDDTYYYNAETHGTHTSSIAGGSDFTATAYVYTTGTSYSTVSNAKFGGMAPGTELVLCDLGEELTDANIAACIKYISDYADQEGKPCVTSLSLGGHYGPHDGTGDMADICAQYTGKGKIIIFAAGNEGEDKIYLGKNASKSSPVQTVLTSDTRSEYSMDYGVALSYARTPNTELCVCYYVVDTSKNTILWTSNEITTDDYFVDEEGNIELYGAEISVNDTGSDGTTKLSDYFTAYGNNSEKYGYLCGYMEKDSHNNKWYVETVLYYLKPVSSTYKIGMSIYPKTGSCYVDSWPVGYLNFTASSATANGTTFSAGTNDCSISDESTYPSVISVGSYVSSKYWRGGTTSASNQTWTANGTYQQISGFSSYQAPNYGPLGTKLPWITAPGEVILAGYNSGYSPDGNAHYAYGTNKQLGAMSGTSMATPCVAGIVALWLQANSMLTPLQMKEVMASTAIKDTYVTGTYATHFGNGKIDALAGIKKVIEDYDNPVIKATPSTVILDGYATETYTQTVKVKGLYLGGDITATLSSADGVFSIDKTNISMSDAANGADIILTWSPATAGTYSATLTLSSTGAEDEVISITGVAEAAIPTILAESTELEFSTMLNESQSKEIAVSGRFLSGDITVSLNDPSRVFSVSPSTLTAVGGEEALTPLTVTFNSASEGSFTGSVVLTSAGAEDVIISLSAEANDGGTASDAYLNIAKYATIDEAGWNTAYVNKLYEYTEYPDDECAWLTLPVYGAFVGARYSQNGATIGSGQPQKWIESNVSNTNQVKEVTWDATDVYLGSGKYFTSVSAKAVGTNSSSSGSNKTVTFYVTNTTGVKLYGNHNGSTYYPTSLSAYVCTDNGNGSLTAETTATKNASQTDKGVTNLSITGLDASKIYKIVVSQARGYLYEIGFQTPLKPNVDNRSEQTLSYSEIPSMTYGDAAFTLPEETTEGLTLTWASSDVNIATLSGNTLTIKGAGTATITATQEGDDNYKPFTKDFTLEIAKAALCITAKSFTITEGDEMPVFDVEYEGFAYDETSSVLTTQPTVSCGATPTSAPGTYDITVSGAEAQNYEMTYVSGTLTIEAKKILMGDVNDDGDIDVMDVVTMVSYIMGRDSAGFIFEAADHTADGEVDVMDLVCQVDLVMSQAASGAPAVSSFDAFGGGMTLDGESDGALYVGLGDGREYVASQFVITLSDGQQLHSVTADRRHTVSIQSMGDSRYFVMSYSAANETFASSDHALTLRVMGSGMVTVDEGTFVSTDGQKVVFESASSATTGIGSTVFGSNVPADVYSTGGMMIRKGTANTEELPAGVYIVNGKKYIRK